MSYTTWSPSYQQVPPYGMMHAQWPQQQSWSYPAPPMPAAQYFNTPVHAQPPLAPNIPVTLPHIPPPIPVTQHQAPHPIPVTQHQPPLFYPLGEYPVPEPGPPNMGPERPERPQDEEALSDHASDEESQNDDPVTVESRNRDYRQFNRLLGEKLPLFFHTEASNLPYYRNPRGEASRAMFNSPADIPRVKIQPNLEGSWADPTHREDASDTAAYWPHTTKFPSLARITPQDYTQKAPPRNPYLHIVDENLRKTLRAPTFKSVPLDHTAFPVASVDLSHSSLPQMDSILRRAMLDNFSLDEYLQLIIELLPTIEKEDTPPEVKLDNLDLVFRLVVLIAEGNQRSGQSLMAAFVANKLAMRDVVLNKFNAPLTSRQILRGSNFLSPNLFGPLPESFRNSLLHNADTHLRLTSKGAASTRSSASSSQTAPKTRKRQADFSFFNYPKKRRGFGFNKPAASKRKFFRPPYNKKK